MSAAQLATTMNPLHPLVGVSPLLFLFACGGNNTCQTPSTTTDQTSGTYTYSTSSGSTGCTSVSHGEVSASTGATVRAPYEGSLEVIGTYEDAAGEPHQLTLRAGGLSVGAGTSVPGAGGTLCDENDTCAPLNWTADLTAFSTDCQSSSGCLMNVKGSLTASGSLSNGAFTVALTLDHQESWQSTTCAGTDEGSLANREKTRAAIDPAHRVITSFSMTSLMVFDGLVAKCRELPRVAFAVVSPTTEVALSGAMSASAAGLIEPILVGREDEIRSLAARSGIDVSSARVVDALDDADAARKSVALCRDGVAKGLMKGSLHTDVLMHAVLDHERGLRGARRVSHVFVIDAPAYPRALLVTDAAINIYPTLDDKVDIAKNAIELAHALGIAVPNVAILSAVETVSSKIVSTLDAAALCKMADRKQITGAVLDGPLAFDTAVSAAAAAIKQLVSPVAGLADILLVPDLESGNMLAKQLEYLGGAELAGVVLGARVPIVLTSRSDSARARLASCAVAVLRAAAG